MEFIGSRYFLSASWEAVGIDLFRNERNAGERLKLLL